MDAVKTSQGPKAAAIILAILGYIIDTYSAMSGSISPTWAGLAGAGIAVIYLAARTLTKYLQGADPKSVFKTTEFWSCVMVSFANFGLAVAGHIHWAQTGGIVVLLSILMKVGLNMGGTLQTDTITKITTMLILGVSVSTLGGCAWWQKHEAQIACASITTVKDSGQLIQIVSQCSTIAAAWTNVLPCIHAAAGSTWPDDVITCFAAAQAGLASCPAAEHAQLGATALSADAKEKLRQAVNAEYKDKLQ